MWSLALHFRTISLTLHIYKLMQPDATFCENENLDLFVCVRGGGALKITSLISGTSFPVQPSLSCANRLAREEKRGPALMCCMWRIYWSAKPANQWSRKCIIRTMSPTPAPPRVGGYNITRKNINSQTHIHTLTRVHAHTCAMNGLTHVVLWPFCPEMFGR